MNHITHQFTIDGKLPNLNDYIHAINSNRHKGNNLKQESQDIVYYSILKQLRGLKCAEPVYVEYFFYEPNKKRDKDNVSAFAHKVVHDAMQQAGVIKNDNWDGIMGMADNFYVDKNSPRIEVTIHEGF